MGWACWVMGQQQREAECRLAERAAAVVAVAAARHQLAALARIAP